MNPIDELTKEHGPVKLMLRILEKMNEKITGGASIATEDLNNGIGFLKEFADKCHHGKEESLLFPAIKENNIPKEVELVDVLTSEHTEGRGYIKNMTEAIKIKESNPAEFAEIFPDNSQKYIALLDQHIDKENNDLFPEVRQSLSADQLKELEKGFENVEKNIIGEGRHKELHTMVHQLKETYL